MILSSFTQRNTFSCGQVREGLRRTLCYTSIIRQIPEIRGKAFAGEGVCEGFIEPTTEALVVKLSATRSTGHMTWRTRSQICIKIEVESTIVIYASLVNSTPASIAFTLEANLVNVIGVSVVVFNTIAESLDQLCEAFAALTLGSTTSTAGEAGYVTWLACEITDKLIGSAVRYTILSVPYRFSWTSNAASRLIKVIVRIYARACSVTMNVICFGNT